MKSRASLNMIELAAMLLVFALCAALCLRGFVWADGKSEETAIRDEALLCAQNAAEAVKHSRGDLASVEELLGGSTADGSWVYETESFTIKVQPHMDTHEYLGSASVFAEYGEGQGFMLSACWQEVGENG